jgi:HNH/ENDO VII superfamily nuclease
MTLPNGKKTVRIELTGSRPGDYAAANKAAGFRRTPDEFTWHHLEDEGLMMLVPTELHDSVGHSGGVAGHRHRTGIASYD